MNKKETLNKVAKLDKKNQKLFNQKAKLEDEILAIDIEIFKLTGEYDKLIEKLYII